MLTFESKPHTMFILQHICTQTHSINSRRIQSCLPLAVHTASVYGCGIKVFSCSSPKWNKCKTHCLGKFVQTIQIYTQAPFPLVNILCIDQQRSGRKVQYREGFCPLTFSLNNMHKHRLQHVSAFRCCSAQLMLV